MPILALTMLIGKNTSRQGRGIALALTLVVMTILVTLGQTIFTHGSIGSKAFTMTGVGVAAIDIAVVITAVSVVWAIQRSNKKTTTQYYKNKAPFTKS